MGDEIREEKPVEEESIASKIGGLKAMITQMKRMIEENHRQIALGDDVQGRERMIEVLTNEIETKELEIAELKKKILE